MPDYDPAAVSHCPGCGTGLRESERCPWPACTRFGLRATGSGTLDGAAAWDQPERRAWLDLMEAAGWVVEIEHGNRPS